MNLVNKIWNMSPGSFCRGVRKRLHERMRGSRWERIRDGRLRGCELYVPPSGILWEQILEGHYDEFLYEALLGIKDVKGAVVWDVGAHVGYHSLAFAALGADVLAFEPNQTNVERLKMNLDRNSQLGARIRHMALALSDSDGEIDFWVSDDLRGQSTGSHLGTATPPLAKTDYATFRTTRVPMVRIDSLVNDKNERPPGVIKIDVEGAEELVLRGGHETITRHRPILLIEIHHILLMHSVQNLLISWGYTIRVLDEKNATPSRCFILARATK